MCRRIPSALLVAAAWLVCIGAGTVGTTPFDASALPSAFSSPETADDAALVTALLRRLPSSMSVASQGHIIVAANGSPQEATRQARRISEVDTQIRQRSFPNLEPRRIAVVLGESPSAYRRLAETLYPVLSAPAIPASGFYHPHDRLVLVPASVDAGAVSNQLMLSLLRDDNPSAPHWYQEAAATLYETSEWRANRLTPILDQRMKRIAADEDLSYDVFAGICDCSPVTPEQLALMRLLLVFLEQRNQLSALHAAIKEHGQYTTLLEALDTMAFNRVAWKEFAERSVRTYPR